MIAFDKLNYFICININLINKISMNVLIYNPYELNLFKYNNRIVHLMPGTVKLLQNPSLSTIPIPFYYQIPSQQGFISKEGFALASSIQECPINEAIIFFNAPKEDFETLSLEKYK